MIDIHTHIISPELLPDEIFFKRLGIPAKYILHKNKTLNPLYDTVLKGLSYIIDREYTSIGDLKRTVDILTYNFSKTVSVMQEDFKKNGVEKAVVLMLDLGVGYENFNWIDIITKFQLLPKEFIIFYGFDPRRENSLQTLKYLYYNGIVKGVKLYPSLGFSPVPKENPKDISKHLWEFYNFCEINNIPITQHTSKGGIQGNNDFEDLKQMSHPAKWGDVLSDFPDLKICFAHCGGDKDFIDYWLDGEPNWTSYIHFLVQEYENVYCDLSFHDSIIRNPVEYGEALRQMFSDGFMADRVLWGSDYPLHLVYYSYGELVTKIKRLAGEFIWSIMQTNNRRFLQMR